MLICSDYSLTQDQKKGQIEALESLPKCARVATDGEDYGVYYTTTGGRFATRTENGKIVEVVPELQAICKSGIRLRYDFQEWAVIMDVAKDIAMFKSLLHKNMLGHLLGDGATTHS